VFAEQFVEQRVVMSSSVDVSSNTSSSLPVIVEKPGLAGYLHGVAQEWGRITWPTGAQLFWQIVVVLLVTTFTTLFVWCIDLLLRYGIALIVPHAGAR
jgi:preprotein translocase SecE subunit